MFLIEPPAAIDGGEVTLTTKAGAELAIGITWRHYGERELRALLRTNATDAQLLAEMIKAWSGVGDFDGTPIEPSERAIARLLDQLDEAAPKALFQAFNQARRDAARKN
jgi:hypothetical protein